MIKKTITYTDYNGVERTEDFYFNLNKAEVTTMELSEEDGLSKKLETIINSKDNKQIISMFKEIVLSAYGIKTSDGKRFMKNDEIREEFSQTEAYSEIFMELAFNEQSAIEFVNGIMPKQA